jgi:hypothetical protein
MAFVYCSNCNWAQDDFWNRQYNPIRYFLTQMVPWLWLPRRLAGDSPLFPCFSWWMLLKQSWRAVNPVRYWHQRWWTYKSYLRSRERSANGKAMCPKCYGFDLFLD